VQSDFYKLTLVTHKNETPLSDYLNFIQICARAGITCVQLREKNLSYDALVTLGKQLQSILKPLSIPLIINDNLELAIELDAEGVHLGQSDGNPVRAREKLGVNKLIGVSIDNLADLQQANQLPIDYVGIGAIFPSRSKTNVTTIWGIAGLRQLSRCSKHPLIAIGGIDEKNTAEVMLAGASGIAAIECFHTADDPGFMTQTLRTLVDNGD
jgi:thiamine-phosphate pyrophosphorylase